MPRRSHALWGVKKMPQRCQDTKVYMPRWSHAPWGVNKRYSAAVNILQCKCPVRVNIFNFKCHATVDTFNFNWNHLLIL